MSPWKKTFINAFLAQVLSIVGFAFVMPFLPFFIMDLGIETEADQARWAGIVMASAGVTLAFFAPVWGLMADRYGRKPMVVRSMLGGTLVLILMSFVQTVGQLVVCRLLQGVMTGTIAASVALVASVVPDRRSGFALGMMQAAVFIGVSLGPLVGGVVADAFGYRVAFRAGAILTLLGAGLVYFGTKEDFAQATDDGGNGMTFRQIIMASGFATGVLLMFAVRFSNSLGNPSFPLIVERLLGSRVNINGITGSIVASAGLAGALSAALVGHASDRLGNRAVLLACALVAAAASFAHAWAPSLVWLWAVRMVFGLSVAGMMPAVNDIIRSASSTRHIGKAYGAATAVSMIGIAAGPLCGGFLAATYNLRAPFVAAGLAHLGLAVFVAAVVKRRVAPCGPRLRTG